MQRKPAFWICYVHSEQIRYTSQPVRKGIPMDAQASRGFYLRSTALQKYFQGRPQRFAVRQRTQNLLHESRQFWGLPELVKQSQRSEIFHRVERYRLFLQLSGSLQRGGESYFFGRGGESRHP